MIGFIAYVFIGTIVAAISNKVVYKNVPKELDGCPLRSLASGVTGVFWPVVCLGVWPAIGCYILTCKAIDKLTKV